MSVEDPTRIFMVSPENAPFLRGEDRKLRDTGKKIMIVALFGVVLCVICIGVMVSASKELRIRRQLAGSGMAAEGVVLNHKVSYRMGSNLVREKGEWRRRVSSYFVTYIFEVNRPDGQAQRYTREEEVSFNLYDLPIGSKVRIWYQSDDPSVSRLIDNRYGNKALLIFMLPLLALGLLLLFAAVRSMLRNHRLEQQGQLLTGEIVAFEKAEKKRGGGVTVRYRFHSPSGGEVNAKQVEVRKDLNDAEPPSAGTRVSVLYVNDKTHRLL